MTRQTAIKKGTIAKYIGAAHPGLKDCIVKVVGLIMDDDWKPTGDYEVRPYNKQTRQYSWISYDAGPDELKPLPPSQAAKYKREDPTYLVVRKTDQPEGGKQ